jgi:hypothetical protein
MRRRTWQAKAIVEFMDKEKYSVAQFRRFFSHKDSMGRISLHIAAMRDEDKEKPDFCQMLINKGAKAGAEDNNGMGPAELAGKAGRRLSKEWLNDVEEQAKIEQIRYRRRSRSKEDLEVVPSTGAACQSPGDR